MTGRFRIGLLHGAGYAGGELVRLLLAHPGMELVAVTSRSLAGEPVASAHPQLAGQTALRFDAPDAVDAVGLDAVLVAAEHGQAARTISALLERGYGGGIVDLSADFRFDDPGVYPTWFGFEHPAPHLLGRFVYGLPEVAAPYAPGVRLVANPGCFATGLALALNPLAQHLDHLQTSVTALTGASGSGVRPKPTTHYPTRSGNVRAYKVLRHQHLPEVQAVLGPQAEVAFVPASGPWTRGIWGTAHLALPEGVTAEQVAAWYHTAYDHQPFVRTWPGTLPELRYSVGTPFLDVGWVADGRRLVVGFALDNLLKGAASQAVQNLNRVLGLDETTGLLLASTSTATPSVP